MLVVLATCSVIVAVGNGLSENLFFFQRLLRETSRLDELIVVDNGTTDGSGTYLKELPNRKLIRFPVEMGLTTAWNWGLRTASGEAVAIVQTGCVLPTDWLSNLLKLWHAKRKTGLIRSIDRQTVLKYASVFGRYAEAVRGISSGAFSSEADLNQAYNGSFDTFATGLARRYGSQRIATSSAGCFLCSRDLIQEKGCFPEGSQATGAGAIESFLQSIAENGGWARNTATVYTHR